MKKRATHPGVGERRVKSRRFLRFFEEYGESGNACTPWAQVFLGSGPFTPFARAARQMRGVAVNQGLARLQNPGSAGEQPGPPIVGSCASVRPAPSASFLTQTKRPATFAGSRGPQFGERPTAHCVSYA